MRFVWAVVAFIVAAALIGAGVAQRTVLRGPDTQQDALPVDSSQAYTLVDGAVFNKLPGGQVLKVGGTDAVYAAYGRTNDMQAWLADRGYNHVTLKGDKIRNSVVAPTVEAPAVSDEQKAQVEAAEKAGFAVPTATTPVASDLWLDSFTLDKKRDKALQLPSDVSMLIATDGTAPAPSKISLSWKIDNSTPWAGPLMVLGGLAALIGIVLYVLGIRNMRRKRGPRRRGVPPLEETQPMDALDRSERRGLLGSSSKRGARGKRAFVAIPVLTVSAIALAGCTPDAWPQSQPSTPSPSPTSSVVVPENQMPPAVTEAQAERILDDVAKTVAYADEKLDIGVAATRLSGPTLEARTSNYVLRKAITDYAKPDPVPSKPFRIILPQASDSWPRLLMAVWADESDATNPPRIMTLIQDSPWAPYKLAYSAKLEASAEVPDLASAKYGALRVTPESPLLAMAPKDLATAYASLIDEGTKSEWASSFDIDKDALLPKITADRKERLDSFNKTAATTGTFEFATEPGDSEPLALATTKSGAIVAVTVNEVDTVKPTSADAEIRLTDNKALQTLTGKDKSSKGFTTTWGDQLYFYIPSKQSGEKVRLLGFSTGLISSEEVQ